MTTIETIEIDEILREVEVDWDLYKGNDNKRAKNAFVDLIYKLNKKGYKILSEYVNATTKVLIDFNCGHEPNWIRPYNLKKDCGCPKCATKIRNLSKINKAIEDFYKLCKEKGYEILSEYTNDRTKVLIDFNCGHEPNWITPHNLKKGCSCPKCAIENRSGENSLFWKGGTTPLANYLRNTINQWKVDSFKQTNYRCVITGFKGFNVVHHLTGFNTILFETMETLNLPIYQMINEYTEEELKLIEDKCLELHYKYGLGVVLCPEIHEEFHSIYGKGNNTPEQFEEFKQMKLNHKEECA